MLRQFGRYYGRLTRLKQELLSDFARAADLPPPTPGRPVTLRSALVQFAEPTPARTSGIPIAVTSPPVPLSASGSVTGVHGAGFGPGTWSVAVPAVSGEEWKR